MRIQVLATAEGRLGRFTAHDFPNGREVVIGRGDECDLRIDDLQSSRRHARIGWMQGQAFVEDLESKNGTFLHGKPVGQTALRNNDQIQIGSTLLTVTALPFSARTSTTLAFHDRPARVLTTLKQHEADFLADRPTQPPSGQVERPEEVLRELTKISERLASSRDADQAIVAVLNDLQQLLSADTACLLMRDAAGDEWRIVASSEGVGPVGSVTVSRTIIGQAVREGQAILSADPLADERFDPSRSIAAQGISSAVCAPIRIGGGFGGVLSMDRRRRPVAFGNADLRVVATMAGILSLFLEKERLQIEARQKTESDGTGHAP